MMDERFLVLLRRARQTLDSYLFDDVEPSHSDVLELVHKIDEVLPHAAAGLESSRLDELTGSGSSREMRTR